MNRVFIDTNFVAALVSDNDQHHARASELAAQYDGYPSITTDAVLIEIGNALARRFKKQSTDIIEYFFASQDVEIVPLDDALFQKSFGLYRTHKDKAWGMTDCISFIVMRERRITDALTNDKHFCQAGFNALMRES